MHRFPEPLFRTLSIDLIAMSESDLFLVFVKSLKEFGNELRLMRMDLADIKAMMKDQFHEPGKLMDEQDVMQYLNVTSRTLLRWRKENLIAFMKFKGRVYYELSYIRQVKLERDQGSHPTLLSGRVHS